MNAMENTPIGIQPPALSASRNRLQLTAFQESIVSELAGEGCTAPTVCTPFPGVLLGVLLRLPVRLFQGIS